MLKTEGNKEPEKNQFVFAVHAVDLPAYSEMTLDRACTDRKSTAAILLLQAVKAKLLHGRGGVLQWEASSSDLALACQKQIPRVRT